MRGFAELATAVQIGTRRADAPGSSEFPLEPVERAILAELGAAALMRRAGAVATPAEALAECPPEPLRIADAAATPLSEAFGLKAEDVVAEWAERAARMGFVAPPAALPNLLEMNEGARRRVAPVLGVRGRWLAGLMDVDLAEPKDLLPDKEEWDSLEPKDRVWLVEGSPEDLELFTKALADRRKEVRESAVERLARMPGSPQAQELSRMALEAIVVRKGFLKTTMEIVLPDPESLPKWLPRSPVRSGAGERAFALLDIVRWASPSVWGRPVLDLIALAGKTDYEGVLAEGWGQAALRFNDQEWIDALVDYGVLLRQEPYVARATEAAFDAMFVRRLGSQGQGAALLYGLLAQRRSPFSPELSRAVVGAARHGWGSYYAVGDLAPRLHPSVAPLLEEPWPLDGVDERLREHWESVRLQWRRILDLRRRLHESLR